LLSGHYSVPFCHQREQNNTEIVIKHVFQSNFYIFAKYFIEVAGNVSCKKETSCHIKFLEQA